MLQRTQCIAMHNGSGQWGDIAFSVAAQRPLNALPLHLTLTSMTTVAFKVKLDLHIFRNFFKFLYSAVSNECLNSAI